MSHAVFVQRVKYVYLYEVCLSALRTREQLEARSLIITIVSPPLLVNTDQMATLLLLGSSGS